MEELKFNYAGKNFVVIGASSGIGREIAVALAKSGAVVLGIARREKELSVLAEQCGGLLHVAVCDVCDKQNLEEVIKGFVEGNGKIDGVVYTAGICAATPLRFFDEQVARNIMDVNFWGAIYAVQIISKAKYANQGSSYVLLSSASAHSHEKGMFAYSSSKAALCTAVKVMAKELAGKRIRINSISPGWIENDMTEGASFADKEAWLSCQLLSGGHNGNVVGMALFLLSDQADWITGADMVVDGGYLA